MSFPTIPPVFPDDTLELRDEANTLLVSIPNIISNTEEYELELSLKRAYQQEVRTLAGDGKPRPLPLSFTFRMYLDKTEENPWLGLRARISGIRNALAQTRIIAYKSTTLAVRSGASLRESNVRGGKELTLEVLPTRADWQQLGVVYWGTPASIQHSGGTVTSWQNTVSALHLKNQEASPPRYGSSFMNSLPGALFWTDNDSHRLDWEGAALAWLSGIPGAVLIMAAAFYASEGEGIAVPIIRFSIAGDVGSRLDVLMGSDDPPTLRMRGRTSDTDTIAGTDPFTLSTNTPIIIAARWDFLAGTMRFYVNGTLEDSENLASSGLTNPGVSQAAFVGRLGTTATKRFGLSELKLWNTNLTDEEFGDEVADLMTKYGIS